MNPYYGIVLIVYKLYDNLKLGRFIGILNITDNLGYYWIRDCKFCKPGTPSCDESPLETSDSIWMACQ